MPKQWIQKLVEYSKTKAWSVLSNRILSPDGTRYWDRAILNPHIMVPYEHIETDKNLYQTSCFVIVKKQVFNKIKWDETKLVYADREGEMPEDVKYSIDLVSSNIPLSFDKENLVWHNDDSYTEYVVNNIPICLKKEIIEKQTGRDFFLDKTEEFSKLISEF